MTTLTAVPFALATCTGRPFTKTKSLAALASPVAPRESEEPAEVCTVPGVEMVGAAEFLIKKGSGVLAWPLGVETVIVPVVAPDGTVTVMLFDDTLVGVADAPENWTVV